MYSSEKRQDDWVMVGFRGFTLFSLVGMAVLYLFRPTVFEEIPLVAMATVESLLNWGEEKLTGVSTRQNSTGISMYRSVSDFENMDLS